MYSSSLEKTQSGLCACLHREKVRLIFRSCGCGAGNPGSVGWAGRLEAHGRADVAVCVQRLSGSRIPSSSGTSGFPLKAFNCLDAAHLHSGGRSAFLRVHRCNVNLILKIPSQHFAGQPDTWAPSPSHADT